MSKANYLSHNRKIEKQFCFLHKITQKRVVNLKVKVVTIAIVAVEGFGYFHPAVSSLDINGGRYDFDIDKVLFEGANIRDILDATGGMEDIEAAALNYVFNMFTEETPSTSIPVVRIVEPLNGARNVSANY